MASGPSTPIRLRILHLAWEFPPALVGGLGVHVAGLAAAQAARGHAPVVIAADTLTRRWAGVAVYAAGQRPRPNGGPFLTQVMRMQGTLVAAALRLGLRPGNGPWIVHAHDWMVAAASMRLSQILSAPLVATFHATEWGRRGRAAYWDPLASAILGWERRLAAHATLVVTASRTVAAEVFALSGRSALVVPGGVTTTRPTAPRAATPGLIVTAARLVPEKGLATAIEALARLRASGIPFTWHVAGSGPLGPSLQDAADQRQIGSLIRWHGQLSPEALQVLRRRAACYLQPSWYEPFGLAALEALADGVPVVASRVGGMAEWGAPWLTFAAPGDPAQLAAVLAEVLTTGRPHAPDPAALRPLTWEAVAATLDPCLWALVAGQAAHLGA
jgi:glycosyltransferase involved in cell wall biosynthesis